MSEKPEKQTGLDQVRALYAAGRGGEMTIGLVQQKVPISAELASVVRGTLDSAEKAKVAYADVLGAGAAIKQRALATAQALTQLKLLREAIALLGYAVEPSDATAAGFRARLHMMLGEDAQAIAATEVVLGTMLKDSMPAARFVEEALKGTPHESLLRYSPAEIAKLVDLRDAIAVRWAALRRAGRKEEASLMRELCIRYWPERVSVWEAAGNHAIDEGEPDRAGEYYDRALALDATSVAALGGKAIVAEMKKDWTAALELRRTVAEQEKAWGRDDPASLHRVLRYAADLGRLERWVEAAPLFHGAVRRGAFAKLPVERQPLVQTFCRELYAPAVIASFVEAAPSLRSAGPAIEFALRDAEALAGVTMRMAELPDERERALALGMCALHAGTLDDAHGYFDEADTASNDDIKVSYLLFATALESGAEELDSIRDFARGLAGTVLNDSAASEVARYYAVLTLMRCGESPERSGLSAQHQTILQAAGAKAPGPAVTIQILANGAELALLDAWTDIREGFAASGHPPGLGASLAARARLAPRKGEAPEPQSSPSTKPG